MANAEQPAPQQTAAVTFPWKSSPDDEIRANLAIGSLRDSLLMWLKTERGVHAETLLVSIGALAGYSAQSAVWARVAKRDVPMPNAAAAAPEALSEYLRSNGLLVIATTKSGENLYFGDLINGYLVPQAVSRYPDTLWGRVAAGAVANGLPQSDLPDIHPMFRHVSETVGTPEFGIPTVGKEHQPHIAARELLNMFWPRARFIFTRTDGPGPANGHSVPPEYWPVICEEVADQLLRQTKDTLDPRIGLKLVMESAIAMSKVDPKSVPKELPEKDKSQDHR
ncbi:hypothetical protein [Bradyrhizobium sp. SYSU BS000235]|uniref:hypothetical protein n=1 Tax=Bradyrhizobium sp. SYSU BS000235 TaxID=3411332 RepID=UPI003C721147